MNEEMPTRPPEEAPPEEAPPEPDSDAKKFEKAALLADLKDSAEDEMLRTMGIKSCGEIRAYITSTSMDEASKIAYVEKNMTDVNYLKAFIKKSGLSATHMKLLAGGSNEILAMLELQIKNMFLKRPGGITDEDIVEKQDCAYLKLLLKTHYGNQTSKWSMITGTVTYFFGVVKNLTVAIWNKLNLVDKMWTLFAASINYGIKIWEWIVRDPKVAYWSLLTLKIGKNRLCSAVGGMVKSLGIDLADNSMFKYMERKFPNASFTPESIYAIFRNDVLKPMVEDFLINTAGKVASNAFEQLGKFAAGGGMTTLGASAGAALAPFTGGASLIISGLFAVSGVIIQSASQAIVEDAAENAERIKYMNYVRRSMDMVMDVVNPMKCLAEIAGVTEDDLVFRNKVAAEGYKAVVANLPSPSVQPSDNCGFNTYTENIITHYNNYEFAVAESKLEQYKKQGSVDLLTGIVCPGNYSIADRWVQVAVYAFLSGKFETDGIVSNITGAAADLAGKVVPDATSYWPFKQVDSGTELTKLQAQLTADDAAAKVNPNDPNLLTAIKRSEIQNAIAITTTRTKEAADKSDLNKIWDEERACGAIASMKKADFINYFGEGKIAGKAALSVNVMEGWILEWDAKYLEWTRSTEIVPGELEEIDNDVFQMVFMMVWDPSDFVPSMGETVKAMGGDFIGMDHNPLLTAGVQTQYFMKAWTINRFMKNMQVDESLTKKMIDAKFYNRGDEDWILRCFKFYHEQATLQEIGAVGDLAVKHKCNLQKVIEASKGADFELFQRVGLMDASRTLNTAKLQLYQRHIKCKTPNMWMQIVNSGEYKNQFQKKFGSDSQQQLYIQQALKSAELIPKYAFLFTRLTPESKKVVKTALQNNLENIVLNKGAKVVEETNHAARLKDTRKDLKARMKEAPEAERAELKKEQKQQKADQLKATETAAALKKQISSIEQAEQERLKHVKGKNKYNYDDDGSLGASVLRKTLASLTTPAQFKTYQMQDPYYKTISSLATKYNAKDWLKTDYCINLKALNDRVKKDGDNAEIVKMKEAYLGVHKISNYLALVGDMANECTAAQTHFYQARRHYQGDRDREIQYKDAAILKKHGLGGSKKRRANTFKNIRRLPRNGQATTHQRHKRLGSTRRRNRRLKARSQGPHHSKKGTHQATRRRHERAKPGRNRSLRR